MTSFWLALLGIAGTACTAVLVLLLEAKATANRATTESSRRIGDLRRESLADFAQILTDYRRAQIATWFEAHDHRELSQALDHDEVPSARETRDLRAATWGALYRVRLLWEEIDVTKGAEQLLDRASELKKSPSQEALAKEADEIRADLGNLIDEARQHVVR